MIYRQEKINAREYKHFRRFGMLFLDRCGSQRSRPLRFSMVYSRGPVHLCLKSPKRLMTQQIATSTIWTYANVIQHKSLSCPYLKITRALKNKRTLLLLYTSSWHTNIYEWSVKFVNLLLPAVSLYKEHAKCNKKVINQKLQCYPYETERNWVT